MLVLVHAHDWYDAALRLATARGWSQAHLSERTGISETRLSRMKQRKLEVTVEVILTLARALELDPVEALTQIGALTSGEVVSFGDKMSAREMAPVELAARVRDAAEALYDTMVAMRRQVDDGPDRVAELMFTDPDAFFRLRDQAARQLAENTGSSSGDLSAHPLADEADAVPQMLLDEQRDDVPRSA